MALSTVVLLEVSRPTPICPHPNPTTSPSSKASIQGNALQSIPSSKFPFSQLNTFHLALNYKAPRLPLNCTILKDKIGTRDISETSGADGVPGVCRVSARWSCQMAGGHSRGTAKKALDLRECSPPVSTITMGVPLRGTAPKNYASRRLYAVLEFCSACCPPGHDL